MRNNLEIIFQTSKLQILTKKRKKKERNADYNAKENEEENKNSDRQVRLPEQEPGASSKPSTSRSQQQTELVSRQRRVSIRAPKAIRCSRSIMPDHNCVAITFLLSSVHSWAASFHPGSARQNKLLFPRCFRRRLLF